MVFKQITDYTYSLYLLRLAALSLTWLYACSVGLNTKKRIDFHTNKNILQKFYVRNMKIFEDKLNSDFNDKFLKADRYDFNGIYLPKIENTNLIRAIYDDIFKIYVEEHDNYDYKIVDRIDKIVSEGSYCYHGPNGEDITIKPADIVIDAGAWIGDFSAYACKKGAHAYAFEPAPKTIELLKKTIEFNKGNSGSITIVPYGLAEKESTMNFFENSDNNNTGGNNFTTEKSKNTLQLQITTIDDWVKKNKIKKIDFIKADIEGFERHMLHGATKTLHDLAPTLSLCTYHFPEDPELLSQIILEANPNYTIIQRKMKLFAYIEKR